MLTAVAGRRWIIGHGLRLAFMKCCQSLDYQTALGKVISLAIDDNLILFLWPLESTQSEFVCSSYGQNSEQVSGDLYLEFTSSFKLLIFALSRPPVKRKLASGSSSSRTTRAKTSTSKYDVPFLTVSDDDEGLSNVPELKDTTAYYLKISAITPPSWKNHLDNYMDVELLDLHDRCYTWQVVVDNSINKRSRELLEVSEKLRGECNGKISTLSTEVKEHKANLDRMMLKSQKWASYQASLLTLESQIASLEAEKAWLEAVEVSLRKEVDDVKRDRMEVVLKVVPYAAMELIHGNDLGSLVGSLVSSTIFYGRCKAFEQVAAMKEPFDLSKVKGYHPSYKKEHDQASNDLATATFPWLSKFVADPSASVEVLLSKKPSFLQRPAPSKTQAHVASSQKVTPSSVLASNPMSPPADAFVVKPQFFRLNEGHHVGEKDCVTFNPLQRSANIPSRKCFSSLELIVRGTPNLHTTYFQTNLSACFPFIVVRSFASTHFVECSTAIVKNFKPSGAVGKGPRMLTPQLRNDHPFLTIITPFFAAFLIADCSFHFL
ncbi:hypothetical protein Tco_1311208 [Tanacetum coccineum]